MHYTSESQIANTQHNSKMNANSSGDLTNASNLDGVGGVSLNKNALESEKRMRREIANSNERRRMQSINAGFQNLRSLLPRHEGDKLSKVSEKSKTKM